MGMGRRTNRLDNERPDGLELISGFDLGRLQYDGSVIAVNELSQCESMGRMGDFSLC